MKRTATIILAFGLAFITIGLLLSVGIVTAYRNASWDGTYRYRITVDVLVDGVLHSGSSVIEVRLTKRPQIFPEAIPVRSQVYGDAIYVDLGQGRNLVALLASGPNAEDMSFPKSVIPNHFKLSYSDHDLKLYPNLQGSWNLPKREFPTFVTFENLADLQSARVVLPDQFAEVFGPGVALLDIRIEMTSGPVVRDIDKKMLWWNGPFPWLQKSVGDISVDTRQGPFRLTKEHFRRGD